MCFVSLKSSLLFAVFWCHCSHLTDTTIIITRTCPTQLFAILLITTIAWMKLHTQLVTRLLELQLNFARFVGLFYIHVFSLQIVHNVKGSWSHLLEDNRENLCITFSCLLLLVYLEDVRRICVPTNPGWCCCWFACKNHATFICVGVFV